MMYMNIIIEWFEDETREKEQIKKAAITTQKVGDKDNCCGNHDKTLPVYAVNQQQANSKSRCDDVP